MRIFSNFKDYYDIGLAYHDDSIVYERYTKEIEERMEFPENLIGSIRHSWKEMVNSKNVHIYVVCGEVFYVISYSKSIRSMPYIGPKENYIHRSIEDFSHHLNDLLKWTFGSYGKNKEPQILEFVNTLLKFQFQYKSPIVHANAFEKKIEINARLSEVEFQKVIDPYQMYQKIETFLANDLAQELNPPVKIEDKYKIPAHGFDKWSFRKKGKNSI